MSETPDIAAVTQRFVEKIKDPYERRDFLRALTQMKGQPAEIALAIMEAGERFGDTVSLLTGAYRQALRLHGILQ